MESNKLSTTNSLNASSRLSLRTSAESGTPQSHILRHGDHIAVAKQPHTFLRCCEGFTSAMILSKLSIDEQDKPVTLETYNIVGHLKSPSEAERLMEQSHCPAVRDMLGRINTSDEADASVPEPESKIKAATIPLDTSGKPNSFKPGVQSAAQPDEVTKSYVDHCDHSELSPSIMVFSDLMCDVIEFVKAVRRGIVALSQNSKAMLSVTLPVFSQTRFPQGVTEALWQAYHQTHSIKDKIVLTQLASALSSNRIYEFNKIPLNEPLDQDQTRYLLTAEIVRAVANKLVHSWGEYAIVVFGALAVDEFVLKSHQINGSDLDFFITTVICGLEDDLTHLELSPATVLVDPAAFLSKFGSLPYAQACYRIGLDNFAKEYQLMKTSVDTWIRVSDLKPSDHIEEISDIDSVFSYKSTPESSSSFGSNRGKSKIVTPHVPTLLLEDAVLHSIYKSLLRTFDRAKFVDLHSQLWENFLHTHRAQATNSIQLQLIQSMQSTDQARQIAQEVFALASSYEPTLLRRYKERERSLSQLNSTTGSISSLGFRFLFSGRPYTQFKAELQSALFPTKSLREILDLGRLSPLQKLLEHHFKTTAIGEWAWLADLKEADYSEEETARLLLISSQTAASLFDEALKRNCSRALEYILKKQLGTVATGEYEWLLDLNNDGLSSRELAKLLVEKSDDIDSELLSLQEIKKTYSHWNTLAAAGQFDSDVHLVDPRAHNSRLRHLEEHILHESYFFECKGSYSTMKISDEGGVLQEPSEPRALLPYFESAALIIDSVRNNLKFLTRNKFCKDAFNILVKSPGERVTEIVTVREAELHVVQMELSTILNNLEQELMQKTIQDMLAPIARSTPLFSRLYPLVLSLDDPKEPTSLSGAPSRSATGVYMPPVSKHLLTRLHISTSPYPTSPESLLLQVCRDFHTLALALDFGLLSYVGSHTSSFETNFEVDSKDIRIRQTVDDTPSFSWSKQSLACLDQYLSSHKVWVLSRHDEVYQADSGNQRLSLLCTISEFADIWGPVWPVPHSDNDQAISQHRLIKGYIAGVDDDCGPGTRREPIKCHWYPQARSETGSRPLSSAFPFHAHLLVGACIEVNKACSYSFECYYAEYKDQMDLLGPKPSFFRREEIAVGINAGQYLGLSAQETYKRVPGITVKDHIRAKLENDALRINPWFLNSWYGVEVSHCTSNARRCQLKDLFSWRPAKSYLVATFPQWMNEPWMQDLTTLKGRPNDAAGKLFRDHAKQLPQILTVIKHFLSLLEATGLEDQHFNIAYLGSSIDRSIRLDIHRNSWTKILGDNHITASYAAVNDACLRQIGHLGCSHEQMITAFETSFNFSSSSKTLETCGRYLKIEPHGQIVRIRKLLPGHKSIELETRQYLRLPAIIKMRISSVREVVDDDQRKKETIQALILSSAESFRGHQKSRKGKEPEPRSISVPIRSSTFSQGGLTASSPGAVWQAV